LEGYVIRRTSRWVHPSALPVQVGLPIIYKNGQIGGSPQATARFLPHQHVATIVSTVVSRLRNHCLLHNHHRVVVKFKQLLVKAAYYYAVSKNDWFLDRFIALSKEGLEIRRKPIVGLLSKFLTRMDDYNRFVYSQVCFQTNWLYSRACWPRDKSKWFLYTDESRLNPKFKSVEFQKRAMREVSKRITLLTDRPILGVIPHPIRFLKLTDFGKTLTNIFHC
jgi:hypothetical protein